MSKRRELFVGLIVVLLALAVTPLLAQEASPTAAPAVAAAPQILPALAAGGNTPGALCTVGRQSAAVDPLLSTPAVFCPEPVCGGNDDCSFLCVFGGTCVRSGSCRFCACN